ncbi:MAG TPA: hypothetical protein VL523_15900 [Terriglobia bacterium]|nr:hypothetical protein [Terriglobia bacterium]
MRRSNVALRLQASLLEEAKRVAKSEGVALNQLINVAVAEKVSALRTEEYFLERSSRANIANAKRILRRAGRGKPPVPGDELGEAKGVANSEGGALNRHDAEVRFRARGARGDPKRGLVSLDKLDRRLRRK